jgi:hypothetical protein
LPDTGKPLILHQAFSFAYALTYSPKPSYSIGGILSFHYNPQAHIDSDQRFQMNQWGDASRGIGASLRWYQVKNGSLQFSLLARRQTPWFRISRSFLMRAVTGGTIDVTGIWLQTEAGWDRWGSDESWKTSTIGRLYEHQIYFRVESGIAPVPEQKKPAAVYFYVQVMQPFYMLVKYKDYSQTICRRISYMRFSCGIGMNVFRLHSE